MCNYQEPPTQDKLQHKTNSSLQKPQKLVGSSNAYVSAVSLFPSADRAKIFNHLKYHIFANIITVNP